MGMHLFYSFIEESGWSWFKFNSCYSSSIMIVGGTRAFVENQATDRAYRIGQTEDVTVHKLVTKEL
ncbi:hypothetical protein KHA80_17880 [Anaerobacillus sp. HL2]|nr:hypothetical protein KHA80_17880 [Anaerobacillus sp. HL2]